MELKNLKLLNFKNHSKTDFEFISNVNCFVGNNGSGKTNILDAIHYLSLTKSYFNSSDFASVKFNTDFFTIKGMFEKNDILSDIICNVSSSDGKSIKINNKKYKRFSEHIGSYPVILISPTDNNLIYEGSDRRRKYIDSGISQFNKEYLSNLISYNKTLKQRNQLLKQFAKNNTFDNITLSAYDEMLVSFGKKIHSERKDYLLKLIPVFSKYYSKLSGNNEKVNIVYKSSLNENSFRDLLKENIIKDRHSTFTSMGIHKDDFIFTLNDVAIKTHASQGQQKSFLISLKLSQFEFIKNEIGFSPILLLDDIFDKLDDNRVSSLISFVKEGKFKQVFITDTHKERSEAILSKTNLEYKIFQINNGKII